jgi:hypothetical protein
LSFFERTSLEKVGSFGKGWMNTSGGEETQYVVLSCIVVCIGRVKGQLFTKAEEFGGSWIDSFYDLFSNR